MRARMKEILARLDDLGTRAERWYLEVARRIEAFVRGRGGTPVG
jgi:hypothetical protein